MSFKDHFSGHADLYARYRPRYPEALFAWLASISPDRECAWDCGTGNGQAAGGLARHFSRVTAADASAQQIENAEPHEGVEYRIGSAEHSGLADGSVSLVMVAQALHWFDIDAFFAETKRVLKPGGIIAVSGYTFLAVAPEIDALLVKYYRETTGPFWPPERELVETGYRSIAFPFPEITPPHFEMEAHWQLEQLLGYLRSWSATQKLIAAKGFDPVESLGEEVRKHWGDPESTRQVRWPLALRVGRNLT